MGTDGGRSLFFWLVFTADIRSRHALLVSLFTPHTVWHIARMADVSVLGSRVVT